jgi:sulfur carrier protein ThiS
MTTTYGVWEGHKTVAGLNQLIEEEPEMTLENLLAKVGLKEKVQVFKDEQIDMESLVCKFNS